MKGAVENDDFGHLHAALVAEQPGHLDGGFVGLKARVAEKHVAQTTALNQHSGQLLLQLDVVEVGGMDDLADLLAQGGHQARVGMAQRVDRNACQAVEVAARVVAVKPDSIAVAETDRRFAVGVHQIRLRSRTGHLTPPARSGRWSY